MSLVTILLYYSQFHVLYLLQCFPMIMGIWFFFCVVYIHLNIILVRFKERKGGFEIIMNLTRRNFVML